MRSPVAVAAPLDLRGGQSRPPVVLITLDVMTVADA
jgi:hypothetical protein